MRNKKIIILIIAILALTIGIVCFLLINNLVKLNNNSFDNIQSTQSCANEGQSIGSCVGCKTKCCPTLKILNKSVVNGECINYVLDGSPGLICSNCGNGTCDVQHTENSCNCPEDCK